MSIEPTGDRLGRGKWLHEHCCPDFPYIITWFHLGCAVMAPRGPGLGMKRQVDEALADCVEEPGRVSIVCARCGQSYFT